MEEDSILYIVSGTTDPPRNFSAALRHSARDLKERKG
jgi:hypothetical protein